MVEKLRANATTWKIGVVFILGVVISGTSCVGPSNIGATLNNTYKGGVITFLNPPLDDTRFPYRLDFSELSSPYYEGSEKASIVEPDLLFDGYHQITSNQGIVDYGRPLWLFFCPLINKTSLNYNNSVLEISEIVLGIYINHLIDIPMNKFQSDVQLKECHLYILRTIEGNTVGLAHIGRYIGGINRNHFFWVLIEN